MMDWTYPARTGDSGVFEMGRRLAEHLGKIPDATTFVYDIKEMLRITRRIEGAAVGGRLFVGFQTAAKFDLESPRYRDLISARTGVTVYATGRPEGDDAGVDFREVTADLRRLENQWFLVSNAPEPIAFVSWELGEPSMFGVGGAAAAGKRFVGFISDDPEVVAELVSKLEGVSGTPGPELPETSPPPEIDDRTAAIVAGAGAITPTKSGAGPGAVLVPVGRGDSDNAIHLAIAVAQAEGRDLVVIDRTGEGLLTSPYASVRADDELRPHRDRLFDGTVARREGRAETGCAIEAAASLGLKAGGWFPTAAGADGLSAAVKLFSGALIVVPGEVRRPGIGERIRGMTLNNLGRLGVPVLVAE